VSLKHQHGDSSFHGQASLRSNSTERNEIESPLLHLPGEIRNLIWEYASSGADIDLHNHADGKISVHNHDDLAAFHLPQVCRQTHSETHTLAYALSTFAVPCLEKCKDCITIKPWSVSIFKPAIGAIRFLEPNTYALSLWRYMDDAILDNVKYRPDLFSLRRCFPSLCCIYVSRATMEHLAILTEYCDHPLTSENVQVWKKWVTAVIKWMEGEDMKVIFR
jgi:hypothetical protein